MNTLYLGGESVRSKNSLYSMIAAMMMQVVAIGISLVLPKVQILEYGSQTYGFVAAITQIQSYLSIVGVGLAGSAIFALYKPLADENDEGVHQILYSTKYFYAKASRAYLLAVVGLAVIYPCIIRQFSFLYTALFIFVMGLSGYLDFRFVTKYTVYYSASQKDYMVSIVTCVTNVLRACFIVGLAKMHQSLVVTYSVSLISVCIKIMLYLFFFKKSRFSESFKIKQEITPLEKKNDVVEREILNMIINVAPIVAISVFCVMQDASVYAVYNMVFCGINSIVSVVNQGLVAGFGNVIAKGENELLKAAYRQYEFIFFMIISIAYSCAILVTDRFLGIYTRDFTDTNYIRPMLMLAFVLNGIFSCMRAPANTIILAKGDYRETNKMTRYFCMVVVMGVIIGAKVYGMVGILFGSLCGHILSLVLYSRYSYRKILGLEPIELVKHMIRALALLMIAIGVNHFIFAKVVTTTFTSFLIYSVGVGMITVAIIFTGNLIAEKEIMMALFKRIKVIFS